MKFSTEVVEKMAEIMAQEMNKLSREGKGCTRRKRGCANWCERYLEAQDEEVREQEAVCECGETMSYVCSRKPRS